MRLFSMIWRFGLRLVRSFLSLLSLLFGVFLSLLFVVFIEVPLAILMLIFPPLRRKLQSISSSSSIRHTPPQKMELTAVYSQEDLALVQEILQITAESNSNPEILYPLLQNHLDKLDETFAEKLSQWATITFRTLEPEQVYRWAGVIFEFSTLIEQFPRRNKTNNQEIAIKAYQAVSELITPDAFPDKWAKTRNNLGCVYLTRIKGEKADNLEEAISCYQEALQVCTSNVFPDDWATAQHNSGTAYQKRIRGEKADNLEEAISCYHNALIVRTLDAFPYDWARTQNNLGAAYYNRIKGDKAKNLEEAISCYHNALKVFTPDTFPYDWAETQNNLGNACQKRIRGEKAENLEEAISCYHNALKVFTPDTFPYEWAETQNNLGTAYRNRIRGDKAENLERAISCYHNALDVRTLDTFPYEWAETQNNLGNAYSNRIEGKRAENLEEAISCYHNALDVRTLDTFPYEWAETQNNLGNAYSDRIEGKRAENLEEAISCYHKALDVRTLDAFPYEWAETQNNLGNAYRNRIRDDKAENSEEAISCYHKALEVYTGLGWGFWFGIIKTTLNKEFEVLKLILTTLFFVHPVYTNDAFTYEWARTQNNLGNAYSDRIRGERAENLEKAISCCQKALKVYTPDAFPYEWAITQNNLGTIYQKRIKGKKEDNLETAISCYQASLKVRKTDTFPYEWARTQTNLGLAYSNRIRGERAENLEEAISCCQKALTKYTLDAFPYEWARTQTNLGLAYSNRIEGKRAKNLEEAISCYHNALDVYTPDTFPYEWARTQTNLGLAYSNRIEGKRAKNLEEAISCCHNALDVYTPDAFPQECLLTGRNLGNLAFGEGNWQLAIEEAYSKAIKAIELSRSWAMTPQSKQEVMEAAIDVYHNIVQAYLNTEQTSLAIEYVERSKTRNLVELMATRDLKPRGDFASAILEKLDRLRNEFRTEQIYLAIQERENNTLSESGLPSQPSLPARTPLKQLQQKLDELIEVYISPIDPNFSLTQKVEPIPFSDIQSLINEGTAIVEWYITGEKILTFLVTHHSPEPQVWQSSTEDWTNLRNWVNEYLQTYDTYDSNQEQWREYLVTSLSKLAEILHLDEILFLVPKECERLILIPHRFLHIFPLHALPVSPQLGGRAGGEDKYLLDLFPRGVQYAPSCQLLKLVRDWQRPNFHNLFAIQNPTENLISSDLEVEIIRSFFPDAEVLAQQAASEASLKLHQNLPLANCVHFSCHGTFNSISPLKSHLVLAKDEANTEDGYLTLAEIFGLSLECCRIVTLSACETAFTDFTSLSDEYIGLPSGFLFAGSPSVVSSLWTVDDFSTAFLMIKFYENLRAEQKSQEINIAIALKNAQIWLRNLTPETGEEFFLQQIEPYIDALYGGKSPTAKAFKTGALKRIKEHGTHPFANPFDWAAFTATGF